MATLNRLEPLVEQADHVVPGHGGPIDGARALELLRDADTNKMGSWEISGGVLFLAIKLPDSASATELKAAMDIAAELADNMEIKISGKKDAL